MKSWHEDYKELYVSDESNSEMIDYETEAGVERTERDPDQRHTGDKE